MNAACSARNSCPQRAQHAINDHFHSYATGKTIDGHGAPLPTKKTLTLINGPLADINVEKPREAQISTYEVPGTYRIQYAPKVTIRNKSENHPMKRAEVFLKTSPYQ